MTDSLQRRERRLLEQAGPCAKAEVRMNRRGELIYKIACLASACRDLPPLSRSTYRSGKANGREEALDRWVLHLDFAHHGLDAPCLERLPEARARLAAMKAERDRILGFDPTSDKPRSAP